MYCQDMKFLFWTIKPVLCIEVFYCVLYMECPLREVPVYNLMVFIDNQVAKGEEGSSSYGETSLYQNPYEEYDCIT